MKQDKTRAAEAFLLVVFWAVFIWALSSIPSYHIPKFKIPHIDKAVHLFEFFVFGFLIIRAILKSTSKLELAKMIIFAIIVSSLYAAVDELHQYFTPGRTPDIVDFCFDFIGALAGTMCYYLIKRGTYAKD